MPDRDGAAKLAPHDQSRRARSGMQPLSRAQCSTTSQGARGRVEFVRLRRQQYLFVAESGLIPTPPLAGCQIAPANPASYTHFIVVPRARAYPDKDRTEFGVLF